LSVLTLVMLAVLAFDFGRRRWQAHGRLDLARVPKAIVHRADLHVTLKAGGQVESAKKTLIECELENLQYSNHGLVLSAGGASTILELVADGTMVHEGDLLCRLDSSDYEEIARQQQIKVEEARADHRRAKLMLESAELALHEYRDGTSKQVEEEYLGLTALARADVQRQEDRLDWTRRMGQIGYVPHSRVTDEEHNLKRARFALDQTRSQHGSFRKYIYPAALRLLETDVQNAQSNLAFQDLRLDRQESRLAKFERQIARCSVRAPHDGFVIYARQGDTLPRIEPGAPVRQKQHLFYLPDLSNMQVEARLNESMVDRVRPGMLARVRVDALPRASMEGHIVAVSPLPLGPQAAGNTPDVKNYLGRVQLHVVPDGLLPGMTAEIEIMSDQRRAALVVPPEAVTVEGGREFCYVAHDDSVERRAVAIGSGTTELVEVMRGLDEGEAVVLDPDRRELTADAASPTPEPPAAPALQ
jgi:HlyD family secretion protein